MPAPQDPRFEWVDISTHVLGTEWIRGECNHLTPEPVITVWPDEQLVAWLCVDCDAQLPANYRPNLSGDQAYEDECDRRRMLYSAEVYKNDDWKPDRGDFVDRYTDPSIIGKTL